MAVTLSRGELRACVKVGSTLSGVGALPDPWEWRDLNANPTATADVIRQRFDEGRSPNSGRVVRWPKETGGWRPMVWLDPLDQIAYRAFVGRLVPAIADAVDTANVLSARLISKPPAWELEDWRTGSRERRERGLELLETHTILGVLDVQNFYPSVRRTALEATIGSLRVPSPHPTLHRAEPDYIVASGGSTMDWAEWFEVIQPERKVRPFDYGWTSEPEGLSEGLPSQPVWASLAEGIESGAFDASR